MAKKIRIDFSKTEERSGWNTRQIPAGIYKAKIASVKETEAQDGTAMLVYGFQPTNKRFRTRMFPFYCKLQQNQLWKLRDLLVAAGEKIPKKALNIDPNKVVGREIAIEVEDDVWEGKVRSQVQAVYDTELVDEDEDQFEDSEDQTEDTAEEFEDDEDWEDDLDEDEDDDLDEDDLDDEEDELDDDFDEDEDDLDDEDDWDDFDEEEDEEEEEEEPEPAPKPAKKKRKVRKRK
nr:MAG TPA: Protein of unknown function (DUF669) [Caudoviricetes sp.]